MAQPPVLAIKQLSIAQGDVAQLEVSFENSSANCTAFQFDLTLPAGISIKKDGEGQLMAKLNEDRVSDHKLHVSEILSNTYRFLAYSLSNANISGSSGTLLTVTLNTAADNSLGIVEGQVNTGLLVSANNEMTELGASEVPIKIVEKEYTLTYKVDGKNYKSYNKKYGAKITPEAEPTKEGNTFSGWSEIPNTMPAENVTVTGSFTVNKYKLIYKVDGKEFKSSEVEYGASITSETAPTKEGYTFSGWSEIPNTMPAKDVTVAGNFTVNKYKLIYKVDGKEFKSSEVEYGASITPEAAPTKEGYTFSGWSEIPKKMPAKNATVTGSFTVNKYKLIYKVDGKNYKSYKKKYGAKITPEAEPTKEGYTFSGWDNVPKKMPAKNVTVTGTFSINKYKLVYKVDGTNYKSYNVEYGAAITPEAAPTKEGYTFSGWNEIPQTMPAKNVTVTGSFKETTGILPVIDDSPGTLIYDMQGRRIDHLQKGLNIIRTSDGKTKKVMRK